MLRYEAVHGPLLEDPLCGLPAGHGGRCRSVLALARQRPKDYAKQAVRRERPRAPAAQVPAEPSPGQRIREARCWAGMSQRALGAAVGVSQASISHWETDKFDPGDVMLARIAAATGAPVAWLLPGQAGERSRAA